MSGFPISLVIMNAPHTPSLFSAIELAPRDPILGITEAFAADPNPHKVNLGVGVYYDDNGKLPLLECVKRAERAITDKGAPRGYLPIDGIPAYDKAVKALLFGADSEIVDVRPRRDGAGVGRDGRSQDRRRLPAPLRARRAGLYQHAELGEPSRVVRRAPASS